MHDVILEVDSRLLLVFLPVDDADELRALSLDFLTLILGLYLNGSLTFMFGLDELTLGGTFEGGLNVSCKVVFCFSFVDCFN